MDNAKTGGLIAARRKELGLTQKELAEHLHISDRTVSKWERGAGFPDVSLLEPLGEALGLSAGELLRGEREAEQSSWETIRDAVKLARDQLWATVRRNAAAILLMAAILFFFNAATGFWDRLWTDVTEIDTVVTACTYDMAGNPTGETTVEIVGEWRERRGEPGWYNGRFAIEGIALTCREDANVQISRQKDDYGNLFPYRIGIMSAGTIDFGTLRSFCYVSPSMQSFAVMTGEGTIIATDEHLAQLMALYPNYYHLDNAGYTRDGTDYTK